MGICSNCKNECEEIIKVSEDLKLCEKCVADLNYYYCERCGSWYSEDDTSFYSIGDQKMCESCNNEISHDYEL